MVESAGSFYALKLAYDHFEKDLASFRPMVEQLKSENDELKDRLKAGNKEYTKLNDMNGSMLAKVKGILQTLFSFKLFN